MMEGGKQEIRVKGKEELREKGEGWRGKLKGGMDSEKNYKNGLYETI